MSYKSNISFLFFKFWKCKCVNRYPLANLERKKWKNDFKFLFRFLFLHLEIIYPVLITVKYYLCLN